jgi:hypothetical protein
MGHVLHPEQFLESHMAPELPQSTPNTKPLYREACRMCSQRVDDESSGTIIQRFCYFWIVPLGGCQVRRSIREFYADTWPLRINANYHVVRGSSHLRCAPKAWAAGSTVALVGIPMDLFRYDFVGGRFRGRLCQAQPCDVFSSSSIFSYVHLIAKMGP